MAPPRDGHLNRPARTAAASAWVITDGKAGDLVQCLGVAEALGLLPERKLIRPRRLWAWLAPHGPPDPREAPGRLGGPLQPPYPDIAIASGRRTVPVLRALKRASGHTFTVYLKMPRTSGAADLVWVPEHDPLRGDNVIVTLTSPSSLTRAALDAARAVPDPRLSALPPPRAAMILGGPGARFIFDHRVAETLVGIARGILAGGCSVMVTPSRRTPRALLEALAALEPEAGGRLFVWRGDGANPYVPMLALADWLVVTADSVNMLSEAALTGIPVHVVEPPGGHPKVRRFVDRLVRHGAVRRWAGRLESFAYEPLDATPLVAREIAARYEQWRRAAGMSAPPLEPPPGAP